MAGPRFSSHLPVGSARGVGIEPEVVVDHDHAVLGDRHVAFDGVDAEVERLLEGGQRVFGSEAPGAAMALEVEGVGGEGDERGEQGESDHGGQSGSGLLNSITSQLARPACGAFVFCQRSSLSGGDYVLNPPADPGPVNVETAGQTATKALPLSDPAKP